MIGHPVRHSLSPALHNAGFAAAGLDWVYVALEVPPGGGGPAVAGMRSLGIDGLSVTMPHKADVAAAVDRLAGDAVVLGAVNTVAREGGELVGHNTDGAGFLAALRLDERYDPAGRRCLVVGAGGAAKAVVLALAGAGAREVVVVARRPDAAAAVAALGGPEVRVGTADEADGVDLVVNATPLGMTGVAGPPGAPLPVEAARLGPGQVVVDLVYDPLRTPWLDAAVGRGAAVVNGVGMLTHQAAAAFRLWTGVEAPLAEMRAAVLAELAARATTDRGAAYGGGGGAGPAM